MKLYLAGPMTGLKDFNAPAFRQAAATLRGYGYEVVSPVEVDEEHGLKLDGVPAGTTQHERVTWGECLSRDVKIIADTGIDAIVLLPGWETSKGAKLEAFLGMQLGLSIYEYEDNCTLARRTYCSVMFDIQNSKLGVI